MGNSLEYIKNINYFKGPYVRYYYIYPGANSLGYHQTLDLVDLRIARIALILNFTNIFNKLI